MKVVQQGLFALLLLGGGMTLAGCADGYVGYSGYRGGYYAGYSGYRPSYYGGYGYGYGYSPYRHYGPYYGSSYYGQPYYGSTAIVVSGNRNYAYRNGYRRSSTRDGTVRSRKAARRAIKRSQPSLTPQDQDDEQRYYQSR